MRILLSKKASAWDVGRILEIATELADNPACVGLQTIDGQVGITIEGNGENIDTSRFYEVGGIESIDVDDSAAVQGIPGSNGHDKGLQVRPVEIPYAGVAVGSDDFVVMAGPCAVENEELLLDIAKQVKSRGVKLLRGGAYKPRTSPYSFQGIGDEGLEMLARVRVAAGIAVVTESMEPGTVGKVAEIADIIQIGSRNMQNYPLLREAGRSGKPVLLKRGMSATLEEWLGAAEYVLAEGNPNVILCERGIRTFSRHSRHTLDIGVIPVLRERCALPVIVDPSHATGAASRVSSMAKAALAAGADGVLIEVHPDPANALSDGHQALTFENFDKLMLELKRIAEVSGRKI